MRIRGQRRVIGLAGLVGLGIRLVRLRLSRVGLLWCRVSLLRCRVGLLRCRVGLLRFRVLRRCRVCRIWSRIPRRFLIILRLILVVTASQSRPKGEDNCQTLHFFLSALTQFLRTRSDGFGGLASTDIRGREEGRKEAMVST